MKHAPVGPQREPDAQSRACCHRRSRGRRGRQAGGGTLGAGNAWARTADVVHRTGLGGEVHGGNPSGAGTAWMLPRWVRALPWPCPSTTSRSPSPLARSRALASSETCSASAVTTSSMYWQAVAREMPWSRTSAPGSRGRGTTAAPPRPAKAGQPRGGCEPRTRRPAPDQGHPRQLRCADPTGAARLSNPGLHRDCGRNGQDHHPSARCPWLRPPDGRRVPRPPGSGRPDCAGPPRKRGLIHRSWLKRRRTRRKLGYG